MDPQFTLLDLAKIGEHPVLIHTSENPITLCYDVQIVVGRFDSPEDAMAYINSVSDWIIMQAGGQFAGQA